MALERKDVDPKYKWDLSAIYSDKASFERTFSRVQKLIKGFAVHEKTMTESAAKLLHCMMDMAELEYFIDILWTYSSLSFYVDTTNNAAQALNSRVRSLAVDAGGATWFVSPYLIRLDADKLASWFKECPQLEMFRRRIELITRMKPYTLSDDGEQIMARMEDCLGGASSTRSIFANSDLTYGRIKDEEGKRVQLTDTNYVSYLMSGNRDVRRSAFRTLYKTYAQFGNTFGTMYANHVKERTTLAKIRGFKDSITASTFSDEVTPEIYNNLIKTVHGGLPALYDYYELKRQVLGLDELHLYDIYAPLIGEFDRKYTYEEAVDEVLATLGIFGEEYMFALTQGLNYYGWVDVYPTKGKRGGAFSAGCAGTEPYILLNFNGTYDNVSTLAHEIGHSMHSYYSREYNRPHNSNYTIFVAEVASTVNELLLAHRKLAESKSREEKLYILNQLMETYKGTLYRQTMFAEFERDMHALVESGTPLTCDLLSKKYYKLVKRYFGKGVVCDKQIACEWMRIPHFYTSFYVYKYATCISAASAIVKRIENEGEEYIEKYLDFLKCGGSRSPLDSLLVAGIDMTDPSVVTSAIDDFRASVAEFRRIWEEK